MLSDLFYDKGNDLCQAVNILQCWLELSCIGKPQLGQHLHQLAQFSLVFPNVNRVKPI